MRWTSRDVRYMEEHAHEGAKAVAEALGMSVRSVQSQALRYGVSLRRSWLCPKCGMRSSRPLSGRTGWCSACTKESRRAELEERVREIEEEAMRNEREDRARQRLYARKFRAKKKMKKRV